MNIILNKLHQPDTVALNDLVSKLREDGKDIISLNVGDPDFKTHPIIIEAAANALKDGFTHYSNSRGLPEFRKAVSEFIYQNHNVKYNHETEILASTGAVHAYFIGLSAILNPGDEILLPDPTWMTHFNMAEFLGAKAIHVPSKIENNFFPRIEDLQSVVTEKTKAVIINSPSNPTGAVATDDYLKKLVDFAIKNDIFIIADEVYEKIVFEGRKFTSITSIPEAKERTLLINSFSKTFAMTGWRLGYLAAPKQIIDLAVKASQYTITNHQAFIQRAGVVALTSSEVKNYIHEMVDAYENRRNIATNILNDYKEIIQFSVPSGAFYYFISIKSTGLSSKECALRILDEKLVSVVPGSVYGLNGEGFIRLSLASSEENVEKGFKRVAEWINSNVKL